MQQNDLKRFAKEAKRTKQKGWSINCKLCEETIKRNEVYWQVNDLPICDSCFDLYLLDFRSNPWHN